MNKLLSRRLAQGATLVVDDRLTATQLEAYIARESKLTEVGAWRSPDIQASDEFCASLWAANAQRDRLLLSARQSDTLWRKIVSASTSGASLIDSSRIATWAREAWDLLHAWQLDFRELRAGDTSPGFGAFLTWASKFDRALDQSRWIDKAKVSRLTADQVASYRDLPDYVVRTDLCGETPVLKSLLLKLEEAGCTVDRWSPELVSRSVCRVGLADAREELHRAITWARGRLGGDETARVALVVPRTEENAVALGRYFELDGHGGASAYRLAEGRSLETDAAIGAAIDCLALFSERADFQVLSRWLRSPFVSASVEPLTRRCLAEADLREELVAQLGFSAAYRKAGLDRKIRRSVPALCTALDSVFDRLDRIPRLQSPTRWAGVFQDLLNALEWPGTDVAVTTPVLDAWQRVLEEFASLTPIIGSIDYERALAELRAAVSTVRVPSRLSLEGITVLSRLEDVGPGYDAAWIMGMSDKSWPRSAEPNPLLPHSLQAVQQMPFATPADAAHRCRALMDRLIARVPEIVFSYPLVESEFAAEPSPLLRGFDELDATALPALQAVYAPNVGEVPVESLDDPVPPFSGTAIAGGAGTLATQAHCPLRAFIDSRLSTAALGPLERGIGPRQRGILVHRALELLFTALPGKQQLVAQSKEDLDRHILECVDTAVGERIRGATHSLRVYADLERDRLAPLVRELVELERARAEFVVESLETKLTASIGGLEIGCRIDRIDTLTDGSLAIIDYKTGLSATPADWFRARLAEPQLPLYLQVVEANVEALVIGKLHARSVAYRGVWQTPEAFPGAPFRPIATLDWPAQKSLWSAQLEQLINEYVVGDGRVFVSGLSLAEGFYAPLTRIYEQLESFAQDADGLEA